MSTTWPMRAMLLVVATSGVAQAAPCHVEVAHAPDDVKAAIATWVGKETSCTHDLEVRAVPTDGGLYLFARDSAGRTRDRIVPDAEAAGVLVASWAVDDGEPARPAPAPPPPPAAIIVNPAAVGESLRSQTKMWATVGLAQGVVGNGASGLRADLDVVGLGPFAFGVSGMTAGGRHSDGDGSGYSYAMSEVGVYLSATGTLQSWHHPWRVRASVGVDAGYFYHWRFSDEDDTQWHAVGQVALLAGPQLPHGWAIAVGPVLHLTESGMEMFRRGDYGMLSSDNALLAIYGGVSKTL